MYTNSDKKIKQLKSEIRSLKLQNKELIAANNDLKKNIEDVKRQATIEINRVQKTLNKYEEEIKKEWERSISLARMSKTRYDDLYKRCCKMK